MSWIAYAFYCSSSPSYLRETHPPDSVSAVQPSYLVVEFFDKGPFEDSQLELLRQSMGTPGVPEFAQTARRNFDATHVLWVESERKFESQKAQARNMAGKALNELNRQEEMFLQPIRAEARALIAALEASERAQTGPLRDAISRVKREIDRVRDERRDLERKKRHAEMEARQAEMRARMDNERPLLSDDSGQAPPPFGPSGGGSGQSAPPFAHSGGGSAQAPPPFGPSGGGRSQAPPPFGPSGGGGSGFDAAIQQLERREHEMEEHRRHLEVGTALDAEKSEFRRREQMVETWRMEAESPIKSHFSQARARVTARRDTLVSRVDSAQNAHRVKYLPCMINICHACMGESERAQRFVVPAQQTPSKTDLQNCADLRGEFVGLDQVPAPPSYFPRSQAPHFGPMATVITPHVEALIRIF
uniref:Uncharacterized protein n=1 Tax=Chromera velia CCMP2878 TaxID=1169474 RepID=A0A0G4I0E2_9ALVE|eukprot:Cvel_9924.t1-p1 / transcript=Cvel_9924.t1 / gene=Cvel_9924 / organism=Chromera_velia_CCMP2878 / gene_product=hypothetical protein / transcript_product=hypothetical protein / location=Cvel_scaffold586:37818-45073(+) / protein_length=416 / sequence_SO=supercontig / SO=protein_coding / is_pseudo=false